MARVKIEVPVEQTQHPKAKAVQAHPAHPSDQQSANEPRAGGLTVKKLFFIFVALVAVIYIFNLINDRNQLQKELSSQTTQQTDNIVAEISKTVELPADETPQMRTIEDATKFKQGSEVLNEINDGDVWIFYPKAGKQVFYRPTSKKVIFVVPLAPNSNTNQ